MLENSFQNQSNNSQNLIPNNNSQPNNNQNDNQQQNNFSNIFPNSFNMINKFPFFYPYPSYPSLNNYLMNNNQNFPNNNVPFNSQGFNMSNFILPFYNSNNIINPFNRISNINNQQNEKTETNLNSGTFNNNSNNLNNNNNELSGNNNNHINNNLNFNNRTNKYLKNKNHERKFTCKKCFQKMDFELKKDHILAHKIESTYRKNNQNHKYIQNNNHNHNHNEEEYIPILRRNQNNNYNHNIIPPRISAFFSNMNDINFDHINLFGTHSRKNEHSIKDFNEIEIEDVSKLEEGNKSCVICLEEFVSKEKVVALPCIHFFHSGCINNWLKESNLCPVCKFKLTTENLEKKIKENH